MVKDRSPPQEDREQPASESSQVGSVGAEDTTGPDWLEVLPPETAEKLEPFSEPELETIEHSIEVVRGPLPPHIIAREFDKLTPGASEKILDSVLQDAELERDMVKYNNETERHVAMQSRKALRQIQLLSILVGGATAVTSAITGSTAGFGVAIVFALVGVGGTAVAKLIVELVPERVLPNSKNSD